MRIVYLRLRPYVQAVRNFLKTFREVGESDPFQEKDSIQKKQSTNEKLVCCTSCGVWTPESRAVKLKSNVAYCSHNCLENTAEPIKQKRRSSR